MKQDQKYSIISYVFFGQRWWCNIRRFWVIQKIASANLYKPIHDIINYSISTCPCESVARKGKNYKSLNILQTKSFFNEIKNIFHSFWRAIIWWKYKNFIKTNGYKVEKIRFVSLQKHLCNFVLMPKTHKYLKKDNHN